MSSASGGDGIGSVEANEWTLEGVAPDGMHLVVSTRFGGVASDCTRFEGWVSDESVDGIEITAQLWRRQTPSACTDEGVVEFLQIDLEEPLGDRALIGCGRDDCRSTAGDGGELFVGQVVVTDNAVGVAGPVGIEPYSVAGTPDALIYGSNFGETFALPGDVVIGNEATETVAVNLVTGTELWRSNGWATAVGDDAVYLCRGQDADGLAAVDATTGEDLWVTDLACESLVAHGDLLTVVGSDRNVDGGHRLLIVDAATGAEVSKEPFLDGIDDQVTGFDGATGVGSNTVVAGPQANLVVLDSTGDELARQSAGLGRPVGAVDGVAILSRFDRVVGFDPAAMAELWRHNVDSFSTIAVANESIWSLDRSSGTVSRLDPQTGEPLWTTPIGLSTSFDVAANDTTAYVLTTQALIAVDNVTGTVEWSQYRRYAGG